MRRFPWVLPLLLLAACARESPMRVERPDLGIVVTFPDRAHASRYGDDTPFGRIDWFGHYCLPGQRTDESFHVQVGNIPPGPQSPRTLGQVLEVFERWLVQRFGPLEKQDLGPDQGPGFLYRAKGPEGATIAGVLVIRRGRLHHAQATVRKGGDPRLKAFLDSFQVSP